METVMILGAGVPRAAAKRGCALGQLPPLDADFFEVARVGKYSGYSETVQHLEKLVGDYSAVMTRSLEVVATYLYLKAVDSAPKSKHHIELLRFLWLLNAVLAKTTNSLPVGRNSLTYRVLLSELNKLDDPTKLTVITFNYDLLIEKILESIAKNSRPDVFVFPGCYRIKDYVSMFGPSDYPRFELVGKEYAGVEVLKLHGSMNWQARNISNTPKTDTLFKPSRPLHIMNSTAIFSHLTWKRNKRKMYLKPIIIPPISGKRWLMHAAMLTLWEKAAEKLCKADRIVIAGYSCPPFDIEARSLLSENLRQNKSKKVYVIDPNPESAAKFLDLCGVTHTTIYSSLKSWLSDATC